MSKGFALFGTSRRLSGTLFSDCIGSNDVMVPKETLCMHQAAVSAVAAHGAVFVSSAGNDGNNNDVTSHWPSNIDTSTTISVAALDRTGALWCAHATHTKRMHRPGETLVGAGNDKVHHLLPSAGNVRMGSQHIYMRVFNIHS